MAKRKTDYEAMYCQRTTDANNDPSIEKLHQRAVALLQIVDANKRKEAIGELLIAIETRIKRLLGVQWDQYVYPLLDISNGTMFYATAIVGNRPLSFIMADNPCDLLIMSLEDRRDLYKDELFDDEGVCHQLGGVTIDEWNKLIKIMQSKNPNEVEKIIGLLNLFWDINQGDLAYGLVSWETKTNRITSSSADQKKRYEELEKMTKV